MPRPNLPGQDLVSSPQTNRLSRRNTVDNPTLNDSELFAPSLPQDTQEGRISRLRRWTEEHRENSPVLSRNTEPLDQSMQDVALDDEQENEESDDDWDMVLDYLAVEESEDWYPRPTTMNRIRRYLWSRDEDEDEDRHHNHRPGPLVFDDDGMVSIDEEDEEEDDRPHWRDPAWDYNIPFGPRVQYDYTFEQLYPRTAMALDFAQTLPGMRRLTAARDVVAAWAPTIQNNIARTYNTMAPRAMFTVQRTQEALVMSAQVGSHLAAEAWMAGQNAAQMIQETWEAAQPTVRMLRDGRVMRLLMEGDVMMMLLQDAAMAGLSAVPPYDLILRSSGGRRRL
ncbi:Hypothetical protein NCS54_00785000 [Fusarium falciforme]|uniref:Hypothetical protein n=1 Tax=Fusarium falciforme TaxID=195108 RepID=UPI002300EC64|nr:Hypothetical protein NCS54_00785000 [Fusarium falciforme]WAO90420.1 Hypothetical protein NCS54_00785000 [Fusarium falciforme]